MRVVCTIADFSLRAKEQRDNTSRTASEEILEQSLLLLTHSVILWTNHHSAFCYACPIESGYAHCDCRIWEDGAG
jgi:hypothetical protein